MEKRGVLGCLALSWLASIAPGQTRGVATLEVIVTWEGSPPPERPFSLPPGFSDRHPEQATFCESCARTGTLKDEGLLINPKGQGVRNVAVSLRKTPKNATPLEPRMVDNVGCRFEPHVQFVPVGRPLQVKNSDGFAHNARIVTRGEQVWNGIIGPKRTAESPSLTVSGIYSISCDVHPWMRATVIAARHRWCGVSDFEGRVILKDLPHGKDQTFALWHETLGVASLTVDLDEGQVTVRRLTQRAFTAPK